MSSVNLKKYKFRVNTLYISDRELSVKRTCYKNRVYIYVYEDRVPVVALRVSVYE